MIFLFVVDTGGSMNQVATRGISILDCAKSAIEHFLKVRSQDANHRHDKYLLVTYKGVISGWGSGPKAFFEAVKGLEAYDLSNMGQALICAFDLLNKFRMQGIDTFGFGRNPRFIEPSAIVVLTDGFLQDPEASYRTSRDFEALLSTSSSRLGWDTDYCRSKNRWDQRVFPVLLQFKGIKDHLGVKEASKAIRPHALLHVAAEATGGKVVICRNLRQLLQAMETKIKTLLPGFTARFESGPGYLQFSDLAFLQQQATPSCWLIPEAYLPDNQMETLPARTAHPTLVFHATDAIPKPPLNQIIAIDRFEIHSSKLEGLLIAQKSKVYWPVFVKNSLGDGSEGKPFGLLSLDEKSQKPVLHVYPYNFPRLDTILAGIKSKRGETQLTSILLKQYFATVPPYYTKVLKPILLRMGLYFEVPHPELTLSIGVQKALAEKRKIALSFSRALAANGSKITMSDVEATNDPASLQDFATRLRHHMVGTDLDILVRPSIFDGENMKPIGEMGNYIHVLNSKRILRDPFSEDDQSHKKINFGSRYKRKEKKGTQFAGVDEVEDGDSPRISSTSGRGRKRKHPNGYPPFTLNAFVKKKRDEARGAKASPLPKASDTTSKVVNGTHKDVPVVPVAVKEEEKTSGETQKASSMSREEMWEQNDLFALKRRAIQLFRLARPDTRDFVISLKKIEGDPDFLREFYRHLMELASAHNSNHVAKAISGVAQI